MIDQPLGASLDRDLTTAPGRRADKEIENFISRRDQQRRKEEGERQEEAWKESVRRYEAARDAHLRQEWCETSTTQPRPSVTGPLSKLSWHITRLRSRSIYRSFNPRIPESVSATTEIYRKEHKATITEKLQNNHAATKQPRKLFPQGPGDTRRLDS
jgi:hypothetical protein